MNYLAQDRPDLGYASKEISRSMSRPQKGDMVKLKRAVRYLRAYPRWVVLYAWQQPTSALEVYTDSDWGGCVRTRKSTSGGILFRGCHMLSHWSRTQQLIALSSSEAELNGSIKAGCEGLGAAHMAEELGAPHLIHLYGDSSANHGIAHRAGAGRMKHLSIRQLWLQERVSRGDMTFTKVPRLVNTADMMTHHWTTPESHIHFPRLSSDRRGLQTAPRDVQPEGGGSQTNA